MKRYTSKFLKSLALFYIAFPIIYIVIAAVLFDIPANYCVRALLSPSYYIVTFCAVAAGYGLWEMRRWAWYLLIVADILIAYYTALLGNDYGVSQHKVLAFICAIAALVFGLLRVGREVRVPYFFPKIRWWESNPRYRLSVPSTVTRKDGAALEGQVLDLSQGGCFVKLREDLNEDEAVTVSFRIFGFDLRPSGAVVWRSQSTVTHPKGIGIKFGPLTRAEKRSLRAAFKKMKKMASFYRRYRYLMNQEDFLRGMQEIAKTPPIRDES